MLAQVRSLLWVRERHEVDHALRAVLWCFIAQDQWPKHGSLSRHKWRRLLTPEAPCGSQSHQTLRVVRSRRHNKITDEPESYGCKAVSVSVVGGAFAYCRSHAALLMCLQLLWLMLVLLFFFRLPLVLLSRR